MERGKSKTKGTRTTIKQKREKIETEAQIRTTVSQKSRTRETPAAFLFPLFYAPGHTDILLRAFLLDPINSPAD
jgi:hypothetical protein